MPALSHPSDLADGTYSWGVVSGGMAIREIGGRSGRDDSKGSGGATRLFRVSGTSNPLTARDKMLDGTIDIYAFDGMALESLEYETADSYDSWNFIANYAFVPGVGEYTVSVDTTGGAILVTNAYAQTSYAATGQTATDFGTSIDVQDGVPQGVERVIPALKLNIKAKIHRDYITTPIAYAKILANLTGTMSNGTYLTFASGELLFIGATGEIVGVEPTLDFGFLASKNIATATLGGIAGINKLGHDYLWFDYRRYQDVTSKRTTSAPRAAYVGRIYDFDDFGLLKIGETPP